MKAEELNIMERLIEETLDGSHTLFIPELNEHYHSVNGARQESEHVFIDAGLASTQKNKIRILEVGFGTGLNAFLTLKYANETGKVIEYYSIEKYPLDLEVVEKLNYGELIWPDQQHFFQLMHKADWNKSIKMTNSFELNKIGADINTYLFPTDIDLIYYDAFAPDKQPEMWLPDIFEKLHQHSAPGATIVTYCAKGEVRRNMQAAGFLMERLPGPPGKRHMLRGRKI